MQSSIARQKWIESLSAQEALFLCHDWPFWARADQLAPKEDWTSWLILGGRGAGKTRAGAEWVRAQKEHCQHIALVGETYGDARSVMVEGPSGLLAIAPPNDRPHFEPSRHRLVWGNGAVATLYSASDPESLRGPQFDAAWCDELAKWRYGQACWDMLQFGLRLGERPRQVVTTTPRPVPLLKKLMADPHTVISRASTYANRANLAQAFFDSVVTAYEGTRLGRQELNAELLEDNPDALWTRDIIEAGRQLTAPACIRIVVAIDPPVTSGPDADECGIVAVGLDAQGGFYVLEDLSKGGLKPAEWASRAIGVFDRLKADRVVAEVNQGGEMVEAVLRQIAPHVSFRAVRATKGKAIRAEPVAALYEQGRVHHLGQLAKLEDQLCEFVPGVTRKSPDRMDALVWGITDLMGAGAGRPRVRNL